MSGVIAMLSLPACSGIFEDIYDAPQPEDTRTYGFVAVDDKAHTGRIYIDATDYTEWHYIDLHNKQATTVAVGEEAPGQWDFAIHRYDAKTNGGERGRRFRYAAPNRIPSRGDVHGGRMDDG